MAGLRISVFNSKELQAAVLSIRAAVPEVQAEIRRYTRAELLPAWSEELHANAATQLEAFALADTARVTVSNNTVRLSAGSVNAHLSGGLDVRKDYAPIEFGADRSSVSTFTSTSRRGRKFSVKRHNHRQFAAPRRKGYLFYPTAASLIPRFASLWVQTVMRTIGDAIDKAGKG